MPVKDALDIDQIFDAISYLKGSSVIRMLSGHLGVETFLLGVSNYLKAHAYGMTVTFKLILDPHVDWVKGTPQLTTFGLH